MHVYALYGFGDNLCLNEVYSCVVHIHSLCNSPMCKFPTNNFWMFLLVPLLYCSRSLIVVIVFVGL